MDFSRTVVISARQTWVGDVIQRIEGKVGGSTGCVINFEPPVRVDELVGTTVEKDFFGGDLRHFCLTLGGKSFDVREDVSVYTVPA